MKSKYNSLLFLLSFTSCIFLNNIDHPSNKKVHFNSYRKLEPSLGSADSYQAIKPIHSKIVMGYIIEGFEPSDGQLERISHLALSFLRPLNIKGDVGMTSGWENIDKIISLAQKHNVKSVLSFGGGEFKITSELMGVDKNRKNLINNIINFIDKYNLDGFDCDWEPTWEDDKLEMELTNNTINDYYLIFIKEFRQNLDARFGKGSKSFSAAVLNKNSVWYSEDKQIAHFPKNAWWNHLDWVSLMNYDNALGESHATFNSVFGPNGSIAHWKNFGVPVEKIVIGIPFYARADWGDEWIFYKDIMNIKSIINDSIDFISYSKDNSKVKDYGFNGVLTVSKKAREAKKLNLAGVMMWQLAGDLPVEHKKSLLKNISDEMNQ